MKIVDERKPNRNRKSFEKVEDCQFCWKTVKPEAFKRKLVSAENTSFTFEEKEERDRTQKFFVGTRFGEFLYFSTLAKLDRFASKSKTLNLMFTSC